MNNYKETQEKVKVLLETLTTKAWKSASFKEQLINNPKTVIENVTGDKIPENTKIIVDDQTDNSIIYLNIPRKFSLDDIELNEEQLENVSGGAIGLVVAGVIFLVGCGLGYYKNHH